MAAFRFPIETFPPSEHQWRIDGAPLLGGQPISGAPQSADVSAGGWWVCEFTAAILKSTAQYSAWRAVVARLGVGVGLLEVPVLDILQPWPAGFDRRLTADPSGEVITADPDGSDITVDPIDATLSAAVFMPAWPAPDTAPTAAQIAIATGSPLQGGEYFSVIGPSGKVRLHMVAEVLGVADGAYTVTVAPPFREDMDAGTPVDFNNPRCTMKVDIVSVRDAWPKMTPPFLSRPTIKFAESGF